MGLGLCPRPRPAQSAEGWSGVPRSELAELWGFHGGAPQVQVLPLRPNKAIERKPNGFIYLVRFQSLCMLRIRRLGRSRGSLFRRFAPYTRPKSIEKRCFSMLLLSPFYLVSQPLGVCYAICYADWVMIISKSIYFFSCLWYNNRKN